MQKLFTKILVPINFNRNTRWSVDKAVQLANKFGCDVLLAHAQSPPPMFPFLYNLFFWRSGCRHSGDGRKKQMHELKWLYRPKLKDGLMMTSIIVPGNWQTVLKDLIVTEHINLVVIPKGHKRLANAVIEQVNINRLTLQTNCPIMTITKNLNANNLQNIVVPVFDHFPVKKLTMATYLSYETGGCIYLMGTDDSSTTKSPKGNLMRAYQILNDFGKQKIQCDLQGGEDGGESTLAYARNVNADLIVVNPGKESRSKSIWNKLRGRYLCRESNIPVLTVAV